MGFTDWVPPNLQRWLLKFWGCGSGFQKPRIHGDITSGRWELLAGFHPTFNDGFENSEVGGERGGGEGDGRVGVGVQKPKIHDDITSDGWDLLVGSLLIFNDGFESSRDVVRMFRHRGAASPGTVSQPSFPVDDVKRLLVFLSDPTSF